jgi:Right handed beta helix region
LLADLSSKSGAGTIYFESAYSTNDVLFDHTTSNLSGLTDLTIQGGWNGGTGSGYGLSGVTNFSVPLMVTNWNSNVTINDIMISDVTQAQTSSLTGGTNTTGDGLTVTLAPASTGDIALHNVKSNNNAGRGAYLDNCTFSGTCQSAGNITVDSNGEFDNNQTQGLFTLSTGDITIDNVIADNNSSSGAVLQNFTTSANSAITIGNSTFNYNSNAGGSTGLFVHSNGNITLESVVADYNGLVGDPHYGVNLMTSLNLTVDKSDFSNNNHDGIFIGGAQSVSVTCSSANNNAGYGVDTTVSSLTLESVTLHGNSSGAYSASGTPTIGNIDCNPSSGGNGHSSGNQSGSGSGSESGSTPSFITVPVTSEVGNTLDCISYGGSNFVLPDGDLVILPCTSGGGQVTLNDVPSTSLPGKLDAKFTFLSGFSVTTTSPLTGPMTVAYPNLTGKDASHFAILRWDGSSWDNLGGTIDLPTPRHFGIETKLTGTFVLATE